MTCSKSSESASVGHRWASTRTRNSQENYFCPNCDVVQDREVARVVDGKSIKGKSRIPTIADLKYKSVMNSREAGEGKP